jgi:hypothetical protein
MKAINEQRESQQIEQPEPFTPGVTRTMVREHAFALYRDKLNHDQALTLEDWVLAEKDLVKDMETTGLPS